MPKSSVEFTRGASSVKVDEREALLNANKRLSETFNSLAEAFIQFSLAHASVTQLVRLIEDDHPTLFTNDKDHA